MCFPERTRGARQGEGLSLFSSSSWEELPARLSITLITSWDGLPARLSSPSSGALKRGRRGPSGSEGFEERTSPGREPGVMVSCGYSGLFSMIPVGREKTAPSRSRLLVGGMRLILTATIAAAQEQATSTCFTRADFDVNLDADTEAAHAAEVSDRVRRDPLMHDPTLRRLSVGIWNILMQDAHETSSLGMHSLMNANFPGTRFRR